MLKSFETDVEVAGKGQTKQHAFADALSAVQRKVRGLGNDVLVRIKPINVDLIEAQEIKRVDRFLFFFLPRERKQYFVKLKVSVSVSMIEVDKVGFETIVKRSF